MTTRADLIETAARVMFRQRYPASTPGDYDYSRDDYRNMAAAVLDAVLPQITTAEQLEALPDGSKILDESGNAWRKAGPQWLYGTAHDSCTPGWLALNRRPLTVVWQPQPDQEPADA